MSIETRQDGNRFVIALSGTFDFKSVHAFRDAYANLPEAEHYEVDLSAVEHMDSSALGMLLNFRRSVGDDKPVILRGAKPAVRKILEISRFDKMFGLED
ncbi:STAS domain-containing protein [Hahella sp. SMD15-11]|uniref:Anti-sigma factor antagonist n=1 Tax=Thermohahella caldifontis TaxID=3142973 RepID=A0AB39UX23_9GAMM